MKREDSQRAKSNQELDKRISYLFEEQECMPAYYKEDSHNY
ncbi:hypothetical protein CFV95_009545 [Leptospira interrogans]|uniref:Uncharacterized protein n=1 Tax=Leptospira interrogans TaxID=173 RepID=A0AAV9FQA9_LEPIR|nr:hypothetical protein [Leptospira interrogans]KAK2619219.1 hypothetical protein CFV95_009545 [Leptospira interrogans]WOT11337.1 hypothetical protein CFY92_0002210 [Leptospira interrogans]